jgi:hypothetical protein
MRVEWKDWMGILSDTTCRIDPVRVQLVKLQHGIEKCRATTKRGSRLTIPEQPEARDSDHEVRCHHLQHLCEVPDFRERGELASDHACGRAIS